MTAEATGTMPDVATLQYKRRSDALLHLVRNLLFCFFFYVSSYILFYEKIVYFVENIFILVHNFMIIGYIISLQMGCLQ